MVVTVLKHIQDCFEPHLRSFTRFIQRLRPVGTGGRTDVGSVFTDTVLIYRFVRFSLQKLLWHNVSCVSCFFRVFRFKRIYLTQHFLRFSGFWLQKHIFDTILHRFDKHLHSFDKYLHSFDKHLHSFVDKHLHSFDMQLHSFDMQLHLSDKHIFQNSWKFSVILFNLTKNLIKLYIATKCNVFLFAENIQLSLLLYHQMFLKNIGVLQIDFIFRSFSMFMTLTTANGVFIKRALQVKYIQEKNTKFTVYVALGPVVEKLWRSSGGIAPRP